MWAMYDDVPPATYDITKTTPNLILTSDYSSQTKRGLAWATEREASGFPANPAAFGCAKQAEVT